VDPERLRETIGKAPPLSWDDEIWYRSIVVERILFNKRGQYGELEHPVKRELWHALERGIYDQDKQEHGATVPRAVRHATVVTTLLWSLVQEKENQVGFQFGYSSMTLDNQTAYRLNDWSVR
jgi:hypothetical protein